MKTICSANKSPNWITNMFIFIVWVINSKFDNVARHIKK